MPTYAYRCKSCGHEYDKLQKISDKTLAKCPRCGKRGERIITGGAGVVFKGSGFYETDYKRAGEKRKEEKGSGSESSKDTNASKAKAEPTKKETSKGDPS
jgi:putative FmdB family regulatory protein